MKVIIVGAALAFLVVCVVIALLKSRDSDAYMQALEDEEQARYLDAWAKRKAEDESK